LLGVTGRIRSVSTASVIFRLALVRFKAQRDLPVVLAEARAAGRLCSGIAAAGVQLGEWTAGILARQQERTANEYQQPLDRLHTKMMAGPHINSFAQK
jgi:hypothetical protein